MVADPDDFPLVERARQGDRAAFRLIMKRHNQRLYRIARAVLGNETEAEDVVQQSYLNAFEHLSQFRAESRLSTWLTRIALNEALRRRGQRGPPTVDVATIRSSDLPADTQFGADISDPEREAARAEIRRIVEAAVDALPEPFRLVFIMRDIEGISTEETALHLRVRAQTVRTRLHRARRLLRATLEDKLASALNDIFPFSGARCDRFTDGFLDRLGLPTRETLSP